MINNSSHEFQLKMLRSFAYKHQWQEASTDKQIRLVNIFLADYCNRKQKLYLLQRWFERPFTTSKELSRGEVSAILELAYTEEYNHEVEFVNFIRHCLTQYKEKP